ncbi:unnamed protein product [Pedinophyceae sp. YPF-701]|nr:unnamed protein product [Pedinophyceae sp. YPF-701]
MAEEVTYTETYRNQDGKKVRRKVRQVVVKKKKRGNEDVDVAGVGTLAATLLAATAVLGAVAFRLLRRRKQPSDSAPKKPGTSAGTAASSLPRNRQNKKKKQDSKARRRQEGAAGAGPSAGVPQGSLENCGICGGQATKNKGGFVRAKLNGVEGVFHNSCFKCQGCGKQLSGRGTSKSYYEHGKRPWCKECFGEQVAPRCSGCGKPCMGGEGLNRREMTTIEAIGRHWHASCFKCRSCGTRLQGTFVESMGMPLCKRCGGAR